MKPAPAVAPPTPRHPCFRFGYPLGPHQTGMLLEDNEIPRMLDRIYALVARIRHSADLHQILTKNRYAPGFAFPDPYDQCMIATWALMDRSMVSGSFFHHAINPALRVMIDTQVAETALRHSWHSSLVGNSANILSPDISGRIIDALTEAKEKLADSTLKREERNYLRRSVENEREFKKYVHRLFEIHTMLYGVRIHLGYAGPAFGHGDPPPEISIGMAKIHRQRLFGHLDHHFLPKPAGYIHRLECSAAIGCWYQCVLLFEGNRQINLPEIGERVGRYWEREATWGRGAYYNWNTGLQDGEMPGAGHMQHPDALSPLIEFFARLDRCVAIPRTRVQEKGQIRQDRRSNVWRRANPASGVEPAD